jgi:hypothetical protein
MRLRSLGSNTSRDDSESNVHRLEAAKAGDYEYRDNNLEEGNASKTDVGNKANLDNLLPWELVSVTRAVVTRGPQASGDP